MKRRVMILVVCFLFVSFAYSFEEKKSLSLSALGVEKFEIDSGSGFLKVYGREGQETIEVEAEIEVKGISESEKEDFLRKYVKLSLKKRGNRAVLVSNIDHKGWFSPFKSAVINLTVNMPKNMELDVDDGSGTIRIENIKGRIYIDDGSGTIEVKDIIGDVEIDDGSGEVIVYQVTGNVWIDDGSGTVEVSNINGDVTIDDGSGTIDIRDIEGSVTLRDGSGSINVERVEKDVIIKDDGSGSVNISNVKGKVIK